MTWGKVIVLYALGWATAFWLIAHENVKRLVVRPDQYDYICTPYQHGLSCKPAWFVTSYILHDSADCH